MKGSFPRIGNSMWSIRIPPGVRRMQALVGQDAAFDHGREQIKLLAGLEVTTKSVERVAEAIGADIARAEQQEIERSADHRGRSHPHPLCADWTALACP